MRLVVLTFLLAAAAPFFALSGVASAEAPFDGWETSGAGKWVNRMTIEVNKAYFVDPDPSDNKYVFPFAAVSNQSCVSAIVFNSHNALGIGIPSPYSDPSRSTNAGMRLYQPRTNGGGCDEITRPGVGSAKKCDGRGTNYSYYGESGFTEWTGCDKKINNADARLISFFVDSDGNVKNISPYQAISFVVAPNQWNGHPTYIRSDELQAPCKDVIVNNGGRWLLFSLKPGNARNWTTYYDVVRAATGAGTITQDACDFDDETFLKTYKAALADGLEHTGEGGYRIYVGTVENQGQSRGAVSASPLPGGGATGGSAADITPTCESAGFSLNWILCPIYNATTSMVEWMLTEVIQPILQTDPFLDPNGAVFKIWSQFRIYANIFLIIAVIVIVFGQTIGTSKFEAIALRTLLGRLLFVIALINLSIYGMAAFLDGVNVIGNGIGAAMTAPLNGAGLFQFTPTVAGQTGLGITIGTVGFAAAAAGLFTTSTLGAALLPILLFALLPAVLGVGAILFVVVGREGALSLFVIASPVAAAMYALPNLEKQALKFVEVTITVAIIGIILPMLFALSNIMSFLIMKGSIGEGGFTSTLQMLEAYFFTFLPLLAGGFALKMAGGIVASSHALLSGIGKKTHQAILGNPNLESSLRNKAKRRLGAAVTQSQKDILDQGSKIGAGFLARQRARFVGSGLFGNVNARQSAYNAAAAKEREQMTATGDDSDVYAAGGFAVRNGELLPDGVTTNTGPTRYFSSKADQTTGFNKEISAVEYNRGKRFLGKNSHEVGESMMYQLGKAQNENDKRAFRTAFARNALEQGWSEGEMIGAYAHAAYPHKGTHATAWYSTPRYETDATTGEKKVVFDDVADLQLGKHDADRTGRLVYANAAGTGEIFQEKDTNGKTIYTDSTGAAVAATKSGKNVVVMTAAGTETFTPVNVSRADSYKGMIEDFHKSREAFKVNSMNHEDAQVMLKQQQRHEERISANHTLLNSGTLSTAEQARVQREMDRDLEILGKTYETFDAASQRYQSGQINMEENVGAGGAKGAAQSVVISAVQNRRFAMTQLNPTTGSRTIYEPGTTNVMTPTGPVLKKDAPANSVSVPGTSLRNFGATHTGGEIDRTHVAREVARR